MGRRGRCLRSGRLGRGRGRRRACALRRPSGGGGRGGCLFPVPEVADTLHRRHRRLTEVVDDGRDECHCERRCESVAGPHVERLLFVVRHLLARGGAEPEESGHDHGYDRHTRERDERTHRRVQVPDLSREPGLHDEGERREGREHERHELPGLPGVVPDRGFHPALRAVGHPLRERGRDEGRDEHHRPVRWHAEHDEHGVQRRERCQELGAVSADVSERLTLLLRQTKADEEHLPEHGDDRAQDPEEKRSRPHCLQISRHHLGEEILGGRHRPPAGVHDVDPGRREGPGEERPDEPDELHDLDDRPDDREEKEHRREHDETPVLADHPVGGPALLPEPPTPRRRTIFLDTRDVVVDPGEKGVDLQRGEGPVVRDLLTELVERFENLLRGPSTLDVSEKILLEDLLRGAENRPAERVQYAHGFLVPTLAGELEERLLLLLVLVVLVAVGIVPFRDLRLLGTRRNDAVVPLREREGGGHVRPVLHERIERELVIHAHIEERVRRRTTLGLLDRLGARLAASTTLRRLPGDRSGTSPVLVRAEVPLNDLGVLRIVRLGDQDLSLDVRPRRVVVDGPVRLEPGEEDLGRGVGRGAHDAQAGLRRRHADRDRSGVTHGDGLDLLRESLLDLVLIELREVIDATERRAREGLLDGMRPPHHLSFRSDDASNRVCDRTAADARRRLHDELPGGSVLEDASEASRGRGETHARDKGLERRRPRFRGQVIPEIPVGTCGKRCGGSGMSGTVTMGCRHVPSRACSCFKSSVCRFVPTRVVRELECENKTCRRRFPETRPETANCPSDAAFAGTQKTGLFTRKTAKCQPFEPFFG